MKKLIVLITLLSFNLYAKSDIHHFWPKIPFNLVGANLCEYQSAYSHSRFEYMDQMVNLAQNLLYAGDYNPVRSIKEFNRLYNENLVYARRGLGITLEQSFKAYLESYYRDLRPKVKKIQFKYFDRISALLNQGQKVTSKQIESLSLMAYGSYSFSTKCNGDVFATLTIIDKEGFSKDYHGTGKAHLVMSQIASKVFEDYQRTKFPTKIKVGNYTLELLGGLNGSIDKVNRPEDAVFACETLGARLPTQKEYKLLNSYSSWSGGVSLSKLDWVLGANSLLNISSYHHVRGHQTGVNGSYYYICVK